MCRRKGLQLSIAAAALLFVAAPALAETVLPSLAEIAQKQAEQSVPRTAVAFDPKTFDAYVGYYELTPTLVFTVTRQGDKYFAKLGDQLDVQWFPESQTSFFSQVVRAQISFTRDGSGKATGLVLHQGGLEQPAKRISEAQATALVAAQRQHLADDKPLPGSEAAVRHFIETIEADKPDWDANTQMVDVNMRQGWPIAQARIKHLGALKSIAFNKVASNGFDIYDVTFEHGVAQCAILLNEEGKAAGRALFDKPGT